MFYAVDNAFDLIFLIRSHAMYCTMIIFKKETAVSIYFQDILNFKSCHLSALFSDQHHYYAVIAATQDTNAALAKLKLSLREYIVIDDISIAHGDERDAKAQFEYSLRVFPIYLLENVREFYTHITSEIAQYFLEANKLFIDYDFISTESKQLFVFTKKLAGATPANDTEGRQRYPEFYARLDKLVKDEIGGSTSLVLDVIYDNFPLTPNTIPHKHSTLFAIQPDLSTQKSPDRSADFTNTLGF